MPNLTIQMTESELFALDMIAVDKQEWADNVLTNRARIAVEELKDKPEWAQAVALVAKAGGDVSDDWAVLLTGRDAVPPLFETAATSQARIEASDLISTPSNPAPVDAAAPILAHALTLKINLVNSTRTDNGPPYPVSVESLNAIRETYSDIVSSLSAKQMLGKTLTTSDKNTLTLIQNGFAAFSAIDTAAQDIIKAGNPATPIESDTRWTV